MFKKAVLPVMILLSLSSLTGSALAMWVKAIDGNNFEVVPAESTNASIANYAGARVMTMNQINAMAQTGGLQWVEVRSAAQVCLNWWNNHK